MNGTRALFDVLIGNRDARGTGLDETAVTNGYAPGGRPAPPRPHDRPDGIGRRLTAPLKGHRNVMIVGASPRCGATTLAYCLGDALAAFRDDPVIAAELDPRKRGLARRKRPANRWLAQDLASYATAVSTSADVRSFTTVAGTGLQVIYTGTTDLDPAAYDAFTSVVRRFYAVSVVDAGSGRAPAALAQAALRADRIIVTGAPQHIDRMPMVLDWLGQLGRADLAASAVAVLIPASPRDIAYAGPYLSASFPAFQAIPYDQHLATDGEIDSRLLGPQTKDTILQLAALALSL